MIRMKPAPFAFKLGSLVALAIALPAILLIWLGHLGIALAWLLSLPLWVGLFLSLAKPLFSLPEQMRRLQQTPELPLEDLGVAPEAEEVLESYQTLLQQAQGLAQKNAELSLQHQKVEHLYQTLWNFSTSGMVLLNRHRQILSLNPALSFLTGHEARELVGQGVEALWAPEDRKLVELIWQQMEAGQELAVTAGSHSLRLAHKGGEARWVELGIQELPEVCAPFRYLVLARDISGQKQALDLLHLERRKSLVLLDGVKDAVVLMDDLGRVQYLNPAALDLFGTGEEAVSGRFLWAQLPLYKLEDYRREDSELLELGEWVPEPGQYFDLVWVGATGERQAIEMTVLPVREDDTKSGLRILLFKKQDEPVWAGNVEWGQSHDRLTGLANRAAFEVRLEECLHQHLEEQAPNVVALVDLDHFRLLNEQGGREVGDQMLQQVARILLHNVRRGDLVAHLGADEFALLLAGCDSQRALLIAEGIRADLEKYRLAADGREYRITASIGLTELTPQDKDLLQIFRRVDEGCYRSKAQGRNLVSLVEPALGETLPAHQNS